MKWIVYPKLDLDEENQTPLYCAVWLAVGLFILGCYGGEYLCKGLVIVTVVNLLDLCVDSLPLDELNRFLYIAQNL